PDDIWSYYVLETELSQIIAAISAARCAKKPTKELVRRQTAYDTRLRFLVTLVVEEQLTMQ
ncbi:hypothetical protein HK104_008175, partial [Borealophlyctis nickersoniae]